MQHAGHFQNMLVQKPPFIFVLQVRGGHIWNQHEKLAIPAEFHGPSSSLHHVTESTLLKGVSSRHQMGPFFDITQNEQQVRPRRKIGRRCQKGYSLPPTTTINMTFGHFKNV